VRKNQCQISHDIVELGRINLNPKYIYLKIKVYISCQDYSQVLAMAALSLDNLQPQFLELEGKQRKGVILLLHIAFLAEASAAPSRKAVLLSTGLVRKRTSWPSRC
jgi:hypothetical protein